MERSAKILLAGAVLTAGIAVALLFRHPATRVGSPDAGAYNCLVLRQQIGPDGAGPASARPTVRIEMSEKVPHRTVEGTPNILDPMDPGSPPPLLARFYPRQVSLPAIGRTTRTWPVDAAGQTPERTHRIVDGDTLQALADRYLGDRDRYLEIYQANDDKLSHPELLPIGAELKIPPQDPKPAASRTESGLVPIRARTQPATPATPARGVME